MKSISKKINFVCVSFLLSIMFLLGIFSIMGDSLTMDELAHTPAGYSYITQQDMRLNPEHPPLLKDLAGLSVLLGSTLTGSEINFPENIESWQNKINGQWKFGDKWLFESNNPTDKIIFWSRIPMILIMLLLGFYVFRWTKESYGNRAGLLALFLYSLSPTFLAHGRLVTTDVGAAAAFFIATYYLVKWLKDQNWKNLVIAGLVFGLAMLTKFSLALIIPFFVFLTLVWAFLPNKKEESVSFGFFKRGREKVSNRLFKSIFGLMLIGIIGMTLIWPVYMFHTWNYPVEKQASDTEQILDSFGNRLLADPVVWASDKPIIRAYSHYFLGLLMVTQRASGGNTAYFLGEISSQSWPHYFPIVFSIKVPIALLILMMIALYNIFTYRRKKFYAKIFEPLLKATPPLTEKEEKKQESQLIRTGTWLKNHFAEFSLLTLFVIYWITTLRTNLNIGVRHVLPTFPVIYVLVSGQIINWLKLSILPSLKKLPLSFQELTGSLKTIISNIFTAFFKTYLKYLALIILLVWYAWGTFAIYPHFLTYFNEIAGGPSQGHKYVTDSNLDWGQDLKRLSQFVEKNNIQKIYVDYFGGDSPEYRLGNKFEPWWGDRDSSELPSNSWLAISATFLKGGQGEPSEDFKQSTDYYKWLKNEKLVKVIGNSIFVYRIK